MTNKEAIKWLWVERQLIVEIPKDNSKELKEAYDMAIKALEQQRKVGQEREKHDSIELFGAMTLISGAIRAIGTDEETLKTIPGGMLLSEKLRNVQDEFQAEITMNFMDMFKSVARNGEEEDVDEE